jgi:cell division inhibitor SepF
MGLIDEMKRLFHPYEDEDEEYEDELEDEIPEEEPAKRPVRRESARDTREPREPRETREPARTYQPSYRDGYQSGATAGKVVSINTTIRMTVTLVKPNSFDCASEIADNLRDKKAVVLNLEEADKEVARRLVDFLSGAAYALEGKVKRVSAATYLVTPYNVELEGDQSLEELERNGLYF